MRNYKKYKVWQQSHQFAIKIYGLTKSFPKEEMYGLTSQLRRAALSVPNNIVEGSNRLTDKEFARFLTIAMGSAAEVEYLIIFSLEIGYMDKELEEELLSEIEGISKMIYFLHKKLTNK